MSDEPYPMLITEQGSSGAAHLVTEEQVAVLLAGERPQAMCGRVFLPAALTAPIGPPCPLCEATSDTQQNRAGDAEPATRRRLAALRRFWPIRQRSGTPPARPHREALSPA